MSRRKLPKKNAQRKDQPSKQRKHRIFAIATPDQNGRLSLTYDPAKGGFKIANLLQGTLRHEISYDKDSGKEKVLLSIPCISGTGNFGVKDDLQKNFDYLFSIDTNTKVINGERLSVCVSYQVPQRLSSYTKDIPFHPFLCFEINSVAKDVNPEVIGWHIIIKQIMSCPGYSLDHRLGLIVDSEKDVHDNFNTRKAPYYAGILLPQNMSFVYASSDGGKDLPNLMISYCEKVAKRALEYFEKNNVPCNRRENGDTNFLGYRQLNLRRQ
jgi:hypothetical protein